MAGSITISSITLDSDNNFSIRSNTGATIFSANGSGIVSGVQNTSIVGVITGTQLASNTISNTNIQTGAIENYGRATGLFAMRNRIINGAMVIDQRNAGASVTANNDVFGVDRFQTVATQASKFSIQQNAGSVTPPTGFTNYLGVTSSSAYAVVTSDIFSQRQIIEGFNIADLNWGTANAKTVTLSFWVRSSLTGTFGGSLLNADATRSYPFSYTISAANTWEQKSVTIAGETTGTWLTTNGRGIQVNFGLGCGSTYNGTAGAWASAAYYSATGATSVVGTNGATFYITGVQLEVGSSATGFEYRQYGQELALCQRYCTFIGSLSASSSSIAIGSAGTATEADMIFNLPVTMRTTPSVSAYTGSTYRAYDFNASTPTVATPTISSGSPTCVYVYLTGTGLTQYRPYTLQVTSSAGGVLFTAEL